MADESTEGVWFVDTDLKIAYVNRRMADMLGYTPDEMLDRPALNFIAESHRERAASGLERHRSGIPQQAEMCCRRKDGTDFWGVFAFVPLMDDDNVLIGMMGVVTDATDRKRAEDALRESEARLELAQNAAEIGVWDLDLKQGKCTWSDKLFDLYGMVQTGKPVLYDDWLQRVHR